MNRYCKNGATYACYFITAVLAICNLYVMYSVPYCETVKAKPAIDMRSNFDLSAEVKQNVCLSQQQSAKIHVPVQPEPLNIKQAQSYYDVPLSHDLQDYIFSECKTNGVSADIVITLIQVESGFDPSFISKTKDYGLMQINICHKESLERDLRITNLLDSKQNIKAGVHMLSCIVDKYPDLDKALMVYNLGETGAKRLWKRGIYQTQYTQKVQTQIKNLVRCKDDETGSPN